MALVDYSGSESSEDEEKSSSKVSIKPETKLKKPAFQKVIDSSDPHKIRVSLPQPPSIDQNGDESERPSKRTKIGSGGISGFNALLPAPKRAAGAKTGSSSEGSKKGGLGSGVNLKTGAAPGFSREIEPSLEKEGNYEAGEGTTNVDGMQEDRSTMGLPASKETTSSLEKQTEELKPKAKNTMFKPLSVARKPAKKKASIPDNSGISNVQNGTSVQRSQPAPKVSLFATQDTHEVSSNGSTTKGPYQPMVYQSDSPSPGLSSLDAKLDNNSEEPSNGNTSNSLNPPGPQSLDTIASDLNLSASAKRQLFGRQKNNLSGVNVVNFNIDEEYKANEAARQSGEQVQHNPVRAIAPGKHSLKQLVNMGTSQADALEESFASGKRNRSEAGSKYGW